MDANTPGTGVLALRLGTPDAINHTSQRVELRKGQTKRQAGSHVENHSDTLVDAGNQDDASCNCEGIGEQQVVPRTASADKLEWIVIALPKVMADEYKEQLENAILAMP